MLLDAAQVRLELARPGDATQLGGEGAAAGRGRRGPSWGWSLVLTPTYHHSKRYGTLPQQTILAQQSEEWGSVLLRRRDFLTASFFARRRGTRQVTSWGRAPWRQGAVLGQRWWRCSVSYVARSRRRVRRREGRRRGAPCGADELGDAVELVLVEVVDRAIAQELVRHEEHGPCVHGSATSVGRGTGRGQRWSGGAAVPPH